MKRTAALLLIILQSFVCFAENDSIPKKKSFFRRIGHGISEFVKDFSTVDTAYVEPQHYNYALMLQNTNTYELYEIRTKEGNSITFSPEPSIKLGPYFGWRWVFLGYTFDLTNIGGRNSAKREFDLSLYSSQIGVDLFYRKTGNDFKIRDLYLGDKIDTRKVENVPYNGLEASITGFNLYYIFNHRKFSYPAAFSQSTVQRRSCGSPMMGIGYTVHTLSIDWQKLSSIVKDKLGSSIPTVDIDNNLSFGKIKYTDVSVSGGYAYNWVFAHNWLFCASASAAIAYKRTKSNEQKATFLEDLSLKNVNFDGVGRFGIVWNNTKWYFGASTIVHSYNLRKQQFSTSNFFGSLNIYIGFNFDKK